MKKLSLWFILLLFVTTGAFAGDYKIKRGLPQEGVSFLQSVYGGGFFTLWAYDPTTQTFSIASTTTTVTNLTVTGTCTGCATGSIVPTGTGFTHITSGAQDTAAALVTNADVSSSAAIAESKISGLTTDLAAKAPVDSPTFTGTVTFPSPFTLGATSITATAAELNYLSGVTSAVQTQLSTKAPLASPTFTGTATAANLTVTGTCTGCGGGGSTAVTGEIAYTTPPTSGWSWVNQGDSTADTTVPNVLYITHPTVSGNYDNRLYLRARGSNITWTGRFRADSFPGRKDNYMNGIAIRNSANGNILHYAMQCSAQCRPVTIFFTDATTYGGFNTDLNTQQQWYPTTTPYWIRVRYTSGDTTFHADYSFDGYHWVTDVFTDNTHMSSAFDQVGIDNYCSIAASTNQTGLALLSWTETP